MNLEVGNRLAHYEILGMLGAGGMGVVYRARDTRLEREVAIKVLPESFVADEDRLRRFEREAKVLASLNHPNIDGIHGIDQQDDTCYLVLELVPGESLAERLARGPLPIFETVDVCRQIAEGLEAAHEAGVVHRDLKPANVRITPDHAVKVLDFGLAKPLLKSASGAVTTADPDSFLMTQDGVVLGTPTYMSPEQARGRPVDRRADIWAFGCVLFECLTGARAFPGSEVLEILATIQQAEPDWERLPAKTPPHVEQLLRRCLEKDPRRRLRDIGEARLALESPSGSLAAPAQAALPGERRAHASPLPWALFLLATAALVWAYLRPAPERTELRAADRGATRFQVDVPLEDRRPFDRVTDVAVSPDGRSVVFALASKDDRLYVRDLDSLELRVLIDEGVDDLCFSPDGRWLAYHSSLHDEVRRIRLDGGASLPVAALRESSGFAWSPDGYLVLARNWGNPLERLSVEGGAFADLVPFDLDAGERHQLDPFFLPGSATLLFCVWTGEAWEEARLLAFDTRSGTKKVLPVKGTTPAFVSLGGGASGALLWTIASTLWAQRFDAERLELAGDPVQILEGIQFNLQSGQALYHVSESGTLAYVPGDARPDELRLVWLDREGNAEVACPEAGPYEDPALSRDGKRAVLCRSGPVYQVHVLDLTRPLAERRPRRFTFEDDAINPSISPDGQTVVYGSNPEGPYGLYLRPTDGGSRPRRIFSRDVIVSSWTSDGSRLAFHMQDPATGNTDLFYLDLGEEGNDLEAHPFVATRAHEYHPVLSPDDRWVAYNAEGDDGKFDLHVASFPDGVHRGQVTRGGASSPRWSPDGSELYYLVGDAFYAVTVQTEPVFSTGPPRKLFESKLGVYDSDYAVAPDGRFLVLQPLTSEDASPSFIVVENWLVELEARLRR